MATITGTLAGILGEEAEGSIEIALCGYGSVVPRVNGRALFSVVTEPDSEVDGDGTFTATLFGNDQIVPAGTYYTVTVKNENGDIVQCNAYLILGSNTYDLNVTDPYDPSQPPPPLPPLIINQLQIVSPSGSMVFDGNSGYTAFKTTLPGDVLTPVVENMVPGNLYTFIIVQDGAGDHLFLWPANVHNGAYADPAPNATTVQTFVCDEAGQLYAIAGGTYYP